MLLLPWENTEHLLGCLARRSQQQGAAQPNTLLLCRSPSHRGAVTDVLAPNTSGSREGHTRETCTLCCLYHMPQLTRQAKQQAGQSELFYSAQAGDVCCAVLPCTERAFYTTLRIRTNISSSLWKSHWGYFTWRRIPLLGISDSNLAGRQFPSPQCHAYQPTATKQIQKNMTAFKLMTQSHPSWTIPYAHHPPHWLYQHLFSLTTAVIRIPTVTNTYHIHCQL